jgi:hypothetical protein
MPAAKRLKRNKLTLDVAPITDNSQGVTVHFPTLNVNRVGLSLSFCTWSVPFGVEKIPGAASAPPAPR